MKKISSNDKGIAKMFLVIIVVAVIAVAAVGAYFVLASDNDDKDNNKNETTVTIDFLVSGIVHTGEKVDIYIDDAKVKTISGVSGVLTNSPSGSEQYKFSGISKEITVTAKLVNSSGTDTIQTTSTKITVLSGTPSYTANIEFTYTDLKITVGADLASNATLEVYVNKDYLAATLDYVSPGLVTFPVIDVGKVALSDGDKTVTVWIKAIDISTGFEKPGLVPVTKDVVVNGVTNVAIVAS